MEGWASDITNIRKRQDAIQKKLIQAQLIKRLPGTVPAHDGSCKYFAVSNPTSEGHRD